jgi:hypothetical protein
MGREVFLRIMQLGKEKGKRSSYFPYIIFHFSFSILCLLAEGWILEFECDAALGVSPNA